MHIKGDPYYFYNMEATDRTLKDTTANDKTQKEKKYIRLKHILLTYNNCLASKEKLATELTLRHKPLAYVIARDIGEEGSPALYCYLQFPEIICIKPNTTFTFLGYIPKIEAMRKLGMFSLRCKASNDYIEKGFSVDSKLYAFKNHSKYVFGNCVPIGTNFTAVEEQLKYDLQPNKDIQSEME